MERRSKREKIRVRGAASDSYFVVITVNLIYFLWMFAINYVSLPTNFEII